MLLEAAVLAALCAPARPEPHHLQLEFHRAAGVLKTELSDPHAYAPTDRMHQVEIIPKRLLKFIHWTDGTSLAAAPDLRNLHVSHQKQLALRARFNISPGGRSDTPFYHSPCSAIG